MVDNKKATFGDYKWKAPAPEEVETETDYSFSFNPEEQYFGKRCISRWQHMNQLITEILCMNDSVLFSNISGYLEVSRSGRIHFHGRVQINDIIPFYTEFLPAIQKHGTYEIDTIDSENEWVRYCEKQSHMLTMFNIKVDNGKTYKKACARASLLPILDNHESNENPMDRFCKAKVITTSGRKVL